MSNLSPRQFGQQQFPGMETQPVQAAQRPRMTNAVFNPWSTEHNSLGARARAVTEATATQQGDFSRNTDSFNRPVGMRGSIPDRMALAGRLQKKRQAESRWETYRSRMDDELNGDDMEDMPAPHPRTGLPSWGNIPTHREPWDDEHSAIGFGQGSVPAGLSFHGSTASARRRAAHVEYVPTPLLDTVQDRVSAQRVHQAMEEPETTKNPRIPEQTGYEDLPHVYKAKVTRDRFNYTLIDGNHRASADLLQGKLFTRAHVLTDDDRQAVNYGSQHVWAAKQMAESNPNVDPEASRARLTHLAYGSGYYE